MISSGTRRYLICSDKCISIHIPPVLSHSCATYIVPFNINLREPHKFIAILRHCKSAQLRHAVRIKIAGRCLLTGLVCTTSRKVKFIQVSHRTKCPLRVSPFLSSTSMGWPCAALRRPRGSYELQQRVRKNPPKSKTHPPQFRGEHIEYRHTIVGVLRVRRGFCHGVLLT
jgi:hypothetical protein